MNRAGVGGRGVGRSLAALVAVVLGWTQPMPAAEATFASVTSTVASSVSAHSLAVPVLGCTGGGLLSTTVTLTWPAVSSATTLDPYSSAPTSSYKADGYEIQRSTGSGALSLLSPPPTLGPMTTSYVDNPGGVLATYHYKIRTQKSGWFSAFSNQVTATVGVGTLGVGFLVTCSVG